MCMERTGEIAVGKGDNVNCVSQTYSCWAPSNLHLQLGILHLHISKTHFPVGFSAFILHFFCTLQFLSKKFPLLTNLIALVLVSQSLQVSTFPWPRISSLRTEEDTSHIYWRAQNVFLEREGRPEHSPWAALSLQGHESPSWQSPLRRQRGPGLRGEHTEELELCTQRIKPHPVSQTVPPASAPQLQAQGFSLKDIKSKTNINSQWCCCSFMYLFQWSTEENISRI